MGKKKNYQQKKNSPWLLAPLAFVGVIPLLVKGHQFYTGLGDMPWFAAEEQVDFFLYYKMMAIIMVSAVMLCVLIAQMINQKNKIEFGKRDWIQWAPLAVYMALALLSTLFSEYSYWGFNGIYGQHEPIWVLLGYAVIMFYAFRYVTDEKSLKTVLAAVAGGVFILSLIGAFQAFGMDFFKVGWVKKLISPDLKGNIQFALEEGRSYTTLYNPNYIGMMAVLMIPVLISLVLAADKLWKKAACFVTLILLGITLIGSKSKAGIAVLAVTLCLMVIVYRRLIWRNLKVALPVLAVGILLCGAVIGLRGEELKAAFSNAFHIEKSAKPILSSVKTTDENVELVYHGNKLYVDYDLYQPTITDAIIVKDENGNPVERTLNEFTATLTDERFAGITIQIGYIDNETAGISVNVGGIVMTFSKDTGYNTYEYYTASGKFDTLDSESVARCELLNGYENIASKRGYIWSRTLPLLKKTVLLGTGADSFSLAYPNNDYLGRWNYGYNAQVITKPHSLYLQIAVQTGMVSLLAFVALWCIYAWNTLRVLWRSGFDTLQEKIAVGIFIGTFSYLIAGITNDSTITVAPLYWLLLGIGVAINGKIMKENKTKE